ncbi:acetyl-CoA C-acyltransferase [Mycobacterium sp. NAZ190054]|uniref:acetyl-CoA C-acyltransferase n=1 Tax=Mycobacterium sp. NAZ190054 TaxID=1747766 RepID=UPI000795EB33|nr:acetyl-CoA C-acyltransferase [Mycobacterium sp. NAZ190054]KWX58531.1 acetyl-CoA acetyltransferase [Mycobacterium sp. NAZ190054]
MEEAVIVGAVRSPIGRAHKGALVDVRGDEMLAQVLRALLKQVPEFDVAQIDDVICGTVHQIGETFGNIARVASILAGFPETIPGTTVDRKCGSSLQAIRMACHAVRAGEGKAFIAAGVEKVSRPNMENYPPPFGPNGLNPRLDGTDADLPNLFIPMGQTAENVANKFDVSRDDQDAFAKLSQDRAVRAQDNGFFDREIVPIVREDGSVVAVDDSPRRGTTMEGLSKLRPAFVENGSVTAGNSCPLNDGAAAVLVMSASYAEELGIAPMVRFVGSAVSGLAPEIMGVGPIEAVRKVLKHNRMTISDVDVVELNEAFASQVLAVSRELGIDVLNQLNPNGGAIALGHPFGMTGARIMTTLINDLRSTDRAIGLETMCCGGGMGIAMLVERLT